MRKDDYNRGDSFPLDYIVKEQVEKNIELYRSRYENGLDLFTGEKLEELDYEKNKWNRNT